MTTPATTTPTTAAIDLAGWEKQAIERATRHGEPKWSLDQRRAAAGIARTLSFPSREHELWRRIDFRSAEATLPSLDPFRDPPPTRGIDDLPAPLLERIGGESGHVGLLVQRNGTVVISQQAPELQRQGVIACSMEEGLAKHGDKLRERLGSLVEPDYDWFTAAGAAVRSGGDGRPSTRSSTRSTNSCGW